MYSTGYISRHVDVKNIAKAITLRLIHLYLLTIYSPLILNENRYQ
jgi:hypothetical protein